MKITWPDKLLTLETYTKVNFAYAWIYTAVCIMQTVTEYHFTACWLKKERSTSLLNNSNTSPK